MRDLSPSEVYEYAAEDADITLRLKNVLEPKLKELNLEELFWNVEMPLVPVLAHMEMNGVCIDTNTLKETSVNLTNRLTEIERHIYELAGESFNIASPRQVGEILFGKMKIVDKPKKTKTGQYVTSEEVLQQLRSKSPIIDEILNYRGLKKLLSTYVDSLPNSSTLAQDAFMPRSTKPSHPQDASHPATLTCRTSQYAMTTEERYADASSQSQAVCSFLPTTLK